MNELELSLSVASQVTCGHSHFNYRKKGFHRHNRQPWALFSYLFSFVFGGFSHLKKGIPIFFTELLTWKDFFYFSCFFEYFYFVKHFLLQNLKAFSDPKTYALINVSLKNAQFFGFDLPRSFEISL